MKRGLWRILLLLVAQCVWSGTMSLAEGMDVPVYLEKILGGYYHYDAICPIANDLNFPMIETAKSELSISHDDLRPCMLCAAEESESYYMKAINELSEEELSRQLKEDQLHRIMKDRYTFTFEDWYTLRPNTYTMPDGNDLSKEEALHIAANALAREYGVDSDVGYHLRTIVTCWPNIIHNGDDSLKLYHVQYVDLGHPYFYNVKLITTTGEVIEVQRIENGR
ncbi:MAG: hypothetical protein LBN04_09475 [Oscillospiraceae bacterium]|nr:hypothetical protein [Oscillospiraceae bacterium]